jgi:hypothetical protein
MVPYQRYRAFIYESDEWQQRIVLCFKCPYIKTGDEAIKAILR